VTDLKNKVDERGGKVCSKVRVGICSEVSNLEFLIWSWLMVATR